MKVALIVDEFSVEKGTGIARYSYELYKGLKERGIHVEPIIVEPLKMPFAEAFNHVFRLPYHVMRKVNDFDIVHATSPITGLCFPFIRKPRVMTYHDIISLIFKDSGNSLHARLAAPFFFRIGKWSDRIIAVSSQTKEEIVEYLKIPEEKINVINNGLNDEFKPLVRKKKDLFTIGYVGAFALRKRVDYLIRAFYNLKKKHPYLNVKLDIYGPKKEEYLKLLNLTRGLNLEHYVEFKGFISGEELVKAYNSFDILVISSKWEGFCMPIIEAQRCGVPVIIRDDAHIPMEASKCCIKAKSEGDMAEKIYALLVNHDLRRKMIKEGLEYSKQFTWAKTVENTLRVYEEVLHSGLHGL